MEIERIAMLVQRGEDTQRNKENLLKMEIESQVGKSLIYTQAQLGNKENLLKMEIERTTHHPLTQYSIRNKENLLKMEIESLQHLTSGWYAELTKQRKSPENGD